MTENNQQPICTKCNQPITPPDKVVLQGTGNFHYDCFELPIPELPDDSITQPKSDSPSPSRGLHVATRQPITSCHHISAIVVGSDEGTNHYECPECHEIVDINGSNPNQPAAPNELDEILASLHGKITEQHAEDLKQIVQALIDQERREAKVEENIACQKVVRSLFSTQDQLHEMSRRLAQLEGGE